MATATLRDNIELIIGRQAWAIAETQSKLDDVQAKFDALRGQYQSVKEERDEFERQVTAQREDYERQLTELREAVVTMHRDVSATATVPIAVEEVPDADQHT